MSVHNSYRKPFLIVKPSIFNALIPIFFKNLIGFGLITFAFYFLISIVNMLFVDLIFFPTIGAVLVFIFVLTFLSISIKLFILRLTTYSFYETNAVKSFKFIIIKKRSVVYNRITNITLNVSFWDRLTGAGTIRIHTGDDEVPDIVMRYIKNPEKIENLIYNLIHKKNVNVHQEVKSNFI
jgi:uncharacterized membrane protein YdbT with pleckstrin-like domain